MRTVLSAAAVIAATLTAANAHALISAGILVGQGFKDGYNFGLGARAGRLRLRRVLRGRAESIREHTRPAHVGSNRGVCRKKAGVGDSRHRQGCGWQTRDRETLPSRTAKK